MWTRIKQAWAIYRHLAALQGLLKALGAWRWLVTLVAVGVAAVTAWLAALPWYGQISVGLFVSAFLLFTAGFGMTLYRVYHDSPKEPQASGMTITTAMGSSEQSDKARVVLAHVDNSQFSHFTVTNANPEPVFNVEIRSAPIRGMFFRSTRPITTIQAGDTRRVPRLEFVLQGVEPDTLVEDIVGKLKLDWTERDFAWNYLLNPDFESRTKLPVLFQVYWMGSQAGRWHEVTFEKGQATSVRVMPLGYVPSPQEQQNYPLPKCQYDPGATQRSRPQGRAGKMVEG